MGGNTGDSTRGTVSRRKFMKGAAGAAAGMASIPTALAGSDVFAAGTTVATENALAGSNGWDIDLDDTIEGFPTEYSVNAGQSIGFKIKTASTNYRIDIYRIGYYGGLGGRKVATILPSVPLPQNQPAPITNAALGLVDCGNWAVSATWNVPANAVSGVYFAILVRQDVSGSPSNRIQFVVRNDGRTADILVQTSDTTYQAYNRWGGYSLYWAQDGLPTYGRAVKVSYNRPIIDGELENTFLYGEAPLVRWLERNGYDVAYTANVDTERRPAELLLHKVFISHGHDEYWSGGMRANVEAARNAGVNLIFMTGNEVFWKVRWEASVDGTNSPYKTLVCYKETLANAKIDPSTEWTGTWRDPRFSPPSNGGRPENALTGTLFKAINSTDDPDFAIEVPYAYSRMRMWRNTTIATMAPNTIATLANATLGYEWNTDGDLPGRPPGLIRLSETTKTPTVTLLDFGGTYGVQPLTHYMTMYKAPSGALVWSTGTVQWSWGLDDNHPNRPNVAVPVDQRMQQATLNVLADMGVQPNTRQSNLVAATKTTDTIPPVTTITTPANGASIPAGSLVTVSGTATDSGGGQVAAIEVSTDGGTTWKPATGRTSWSYSFVPWTVGAYNVKVRGIDDSCNIGSGGAGITLNVVARSLPGSIWQGNAVPTVPSADDTSPLELGVRFRTSIAAFATGVRFYKGTGNTGTHTGRVWSAAGALLGTVTFTNETATGWQTAMFASPVSLKANTDYIVSYSAPNGHYSYDVGYFNSAFTLAPLSAPANGDGGANGVYALTPGGFPDRTFGASNYWVDVIVDTNDGRAPTVASVSPGVSVSQVDTASLVSAKFSEAVQSASLQFQLVGPAGGVPGTVSYDAPNQTLNFQPTAALTPLTQYTATVLTARDMNNTLMVAPYSWTFTTAGAVGSIPTGLWTSADVPSIPSVDDFNAVELGVKFRASKNGFVSGIRFYKGPSNGGTHLGRLWSAAGNLLGSVTFTNESESGWQEATFAAPVAVTAGTDYVVSYYAPQGGYSVTPAYFATTRVRGPLTAFDADSINGNGVFRYGVGGGFPTSTYNRGNYWVDVVYSYPADLTKPVAASVSPAMGLQGVAPSSTVAIRFDKPILANSLSITVTRGNNTAVPGTASVDPGDATKATFVPSAPLVAGAIHTVTVNATGQNGTASGAITWTFQTATPAGTSPATLWDTSAVPAIPSADDNSGVELGMKFSVEGDAVVTGIRFYKGPLNTGVHVGHLWNSSGTLLATATFDKESDGGWQQANFAAPVPVVGGQTYVASYYAPNGGYSVTSGGLSSGVDRAPIHALANGVDGGNGVFAYGAGGFPTGSYGASNYWVDVVVVDATAPVVTGQAPTGGSVGIATNTVVQIAFNEPIQSGVAVFELRDAQGGVVASSVGYTAGTRTLTLTPTAALAAGAVYTASVTNVRDSVGNLLSPVIWSFTTA